MSRWKPRLTKGDVIDLFLRRKEENNRITSIQLAKELGCESSYVRATLARAGYPLPRSKQKGPSQSGKVKKQA